MATRKISPNTFSTRKNCENQKETIENILIKFCRRQKMRKKNGLKQAETKPLDLLLTTKNGSNA